MTSVNINYEQWISKLNNREVAFLLYIFQKNYPKLVINNNHSYLNSIIEQIDFNLYSYSLKILDNTLKGGLLPQNYLDWITSDLRNSIWFYGYYSIFPLFGFIYTNFNPMPSFIDNLIFNFDTAILNVNFHELNKNQHYSNIAFAPIHNFGGVNFEEQNQDDSVNNNQPLNINKNLVYFNAALKYDDYLNSKNGNFPKFNFYQNEISPLPNSNSNVTQEEQSSNSPEYFDANKHLDMIIPYHQQAQYGLVEKIDYINRARFIFLNTQTDYKELDWLDKSNDIQLLWALDYLKKANCLVMPPLFYPNDKKEMFEQIAASIDLISINEKVSSGNYNYSPSKELFLQKMRNSWHQKNFREKKDKNSALQSIMTRKEYHQLEKVSRYYGIKPLEFINQSIETEYRAIYKN